ncbi:MAG: hypothetical protein QNI86_14335 [Halieaceae bacterium]|nr:hypothetical protein [Halieaceae bacterium]
MSDLEGCDDEAGVVLRIRERFASIREQVETRGTAPAVNVAGLQGDARVESPTAVGTLRQQQGQVSDVAVSAQPGFRLLIKQNALFTAVLHRLAEEFECLALIRNPLEVLASWQTVDLPVNRGRLPVGERYAPGLAAALDAEASAVPRQLLILDWFYARYRDHLPPERIVRFEDVASAGAAAFSTIFGDTQATAEPLASRPLAQRYPGVDLGALMQALQSGPGAWRDFYTEADCEHARS